MKNLFNFIFFMIVTCSFSYGQINQNSLQTKQFNSDKKIVSARALEIRYANITDTTLNYIIIDNKKYKWYNTRDDAVKDFEDAFLKQDLTVVYINTFGNKQLEKDTEYIEIQEE
ncbi:MAG: hypothetical protein HY738_22820 [Bacteroidia bacterium]|nr:hypothetical protein [Bacteroidia bacterium]